MEWRTRTDGDMCLMKSPTEPFVLGNIQHRNTDETLFKSSFVLRLFNYVPEQRSRIYIVCHDRKTIFGGSKCINAPVCRM